MLVNSLQKFITTPETNPFNPRMIFWFTLSLMFSITFAIPPLLKAFSGEYLIMDDGRQHLFWMQRFVDPDLYPNDIIAEFYQSITPSVVSGTYQLMAKLGIDPLVLNKILPGILGLITTVFCFGVCLELLPIPAVGFIGSLLLNQNLWLQGELTTAVSSGFAYPAFFAFLYFLLKRSWLGVGISIGLLGNIYGPLLLISVPTLILRLMTWENGKLQFSQNRQDYIITAVGLVVAVAVILPYMLSTSEFGPAISGQEARTLPEFLENGRTAFFYDNSWDFWMKNSRSGVRLALNPPLVAFGFLLPVFLQFPQKFPLVQKVSKDIIILLQLLIASFTVYFTAHLILFKLFLPSRYTTHSLRIIMALSAAVVLMILLDTIFKSNKRRAFTALTLTMIIGFVLIAYPSLVWKEAFPRTAYTRGSDPNLYQFLQNQPKDSLVASLSLEADNIPIFAKRSVLVSWEHALPYQVGYYRQLRPRIIDLIDAQYSPNLSTVQQFIQTYGIDYFIIDQQAFTPDYMTSNLWFKQWPDLAQKSLEQLQGKTPPVLLAAKNRCTVYQNQLYFLLDANCIGK